MGPLLGQKGVGSCVCGLTVALGLKSASAKESDEGRRDFERVQGGAHRIHDNYDLLRFSKKWKDKKLR